MLCTSGDCALDAIVRTYCIACIARTGEGIVEHEQNPEGALLVIANAQSSVEKKIEFVCLRFHYLVFGPV